MIVYSVPFAGVKGVGLVLKVGLPDGGGHGPREQVGVVPGPVPNQVGEPGQ